MKKAFGIFLFVLLALLFTSGAFAAESADLTLDPLNGAWKSRILPKYRVGLLYFGYGSEMSFNRITGETTSDISLHEIHRTKPADIGMPWVDDYKRVFAAATAAGTVPTTFKLASPDLFYGVESVHNAPLPVVVNSYIVMQNGNNESKDPVDCEIWLEMLTGNSASPEYRSVKKLNLSIPPTSWVNYYLDAAWHRSHTYETTTHDLAGYDWNKDGYTDYLMSYIGYINGDRGYPRAVLVLIDGKSLYDGNPKIYNVNGASGSEFSDRNNIMTGYTYHWPPTSSRMAIGDFDGDGLPEAAIYFTRVTNRTIKNSAYKPHQLEVYKINPNYTFSNTFTDDSAGGSYSRSNTVGIAAGDIDGDGADEIVSVYAQGDTKNGVFWPYETNLFVSVYKIVNGNYTAVVRDKNIGKTYVMTGKDDKYGSPIHVAVKNLDTEDTPEVVITTTMSPAGAYDNPDQRYLGIWILDWNSKAITDFTTYIYDVRSLGLGWRLHSLYQRHGLAVGEFEFPDATGIFKSYIAVSALGSQQANSNTCWLDWAVLKWSKAEGLKTMHRGDSASGKAEFWISPVLSAMDLYNEGLVVGEPTTIDVQDNPEILAAIQAPPKHWDEIMSGDVMYSMDAMSRYNDASYMVHVGIGETKATTKSESRTSSGTWGLSGSVTVGKAAPAPPAPPDPVLDAGASYSGAASQKNTKTNVTTVNTTVERDADKDDAIFMRVASYRISRYPILFPKSRSVITVKDANGKNVDGQAFVQVVVPMGDNAAFFPSAGKDLFYYLPKRDTYNLFTYPRDLTDIAGYPVGGTVFGKLNGQIAYTTDATSLKLELKESSSESVAKTLKNTFGVHANMSTPAMGLAYKTKINVKLQGDYTFNKDSTVTTDASSTLGITFKIPKGNTLKYGWVGDDVPFFYNMAYYVQEDGAFGVGFSIPALYSGNSKLWGLYSPYNTYPDPGFLMPNRWDKTMKPYLDDAHNPIAGSFYFVPNTNAVTKYDMRGISFVGQDETLKTTDNANARYLVAGGVYSCDIRVVNYSFKDAVSVDVELYYQKIDRVGEPVLTDVGGLKLLGKKDDLTILGRSSNLSDGDNWSDYVIPLSWGTGAEKPQAGELGYIHAVINYGGTQLNVNNDHGAVLVGFYNAEAYQHAAGVSSVSSVIAQSEMPDIKITGVKAYSLKDDGTVGAEMKPDRRQKMRIEGTVKFEGGVIERNGVRHNISHIPAMRMGLFAGHEGHFAGVLAAQEIPLMNAGEEYTFSFDYDPNGIDTRNGAALKAYSPFLHSYMQKDPSSQMSVLWKSETGGNGGGGCNASLYPFALLLVVPLCRRRLCYNRAVAFFLKRGQCDGQKSFIRN